MLIISKNEREKIYCSKSPSSELREMNCERYAHVCFETGKEELLNRSFSLNILLDSRAFAPH